MVKKSSFTVGETLTLVLRDLFAEVWVTVGELGTATVELDGSDEWIENVHLEQKYNELIVTCTEEASKSFFSINGSVTINGITRVFNNQKEDPRKIIITVPHGTALHVESVQKFHSDGLDGEVDITLGGIAQAEVSGATTVRARTDGTSHATFTKVHGEVATNAKGVSVSSFTGDISGAYVNADGTAQVTMEFVNGNVNAKCRGVSRVQIVGRFADVTADSDGTSKIDLQGDCLDFEAEAAGISSITLRGKVTGKLRQRSSGIAHINIG